MADSLPLDYNDQRGGLNILEVIILVMIALIGGALFMGYFFEERTPSGKFRVACEKAGGVPVLSYNWICYAPGIVIPVER